MTTKRKPGIAEIATAVQVRQKMYADRAAAAASGTPAPQPAKIANTSTGSYSGRELSAPAMRLGADDHMALPSRWCGVRRYRDGREVAA